MKVKILLFCILLVFFISGIKSQTFTNVAPSTGLIHQYNGGFNGSGVTVCDYNNDGFDDIFFPNSLGGKIKVDVLLGKVNVKDYDAIVFIGGPGATGYIKNEDALKIAREAVVQNKLLGAICIAPAILARAGILSRRKATIWTSKEDKSPIEFLEKGKAEFIDQDVVVDGKIVTACGPYAAAKFGEIIAELVSRE